MFQKPTPYKLVYVAGPFTATDRNPSQEENIKRASDVAKKWLEAGFAVFCPHTNWGTLEDGSIPWESMMKRCLTVLERCDGIVMCPRWYTSRGSRIEHQHALDNGLPIYYERE